jgi:CRISPR-associated protein Cas6
MSDMPDMADMVFDIKGGKVPVGYTFALWDEIVRVLPWLDAEPDAGILPLRGSESGGNILLAARAKLVLRLPVVRMEQARALSGQELGLGAATLQVGAAAVRHLHPHNTLHAHIVESADGEEEFIAEVASRMSDMGIACKWICGKRREIKYGDRSVRGYSLVLHDLKPEASLEIQRRGLNGNRRYGCGIFVPYKTISGLG